MNPKTEELQARTHTFFLRVSRLCESLPGNSTTRTITQQLTDSAGSTDSNYRGACRARTKKEFISKIGVAAEEADESKGWLLKLRDTGYGDRLETEALIQEAEELIAIFVASEKTARRNLRRRAKSIVNPQSNQSSIHNQINRQSTIKQSAISQSALANPQSANRQLPIANPQLTIV